MKCQPPKSETALEKEKRKKKLLVEEMERLDVLGQENEHKAAKWVIEEGKRTEKEEKGKEAVRLTQLQDNRRTIKGYKETLMTQLFTVVEKIGWPQGYEYGVWFDGKGVILAIKDKYKKLHKRAFKPTGDPKLDANASLIFAVWAEDILDTCEGNMAWQKENPPTGGKIWLPNTSTNKKN